MSNKIINPSQEVIDNAYIKDYDKLYDYSIKNRNSFWEEQAKNLDWYKSWDKVLDDSNKPFYKWFVGAKTNIVHNAVDRHLNTWRKNKLAIIWESENGDKKTYSYHALNREVSKMANILKSMGAKKGEVITIYMPQIPEMIFAMLACAKIGAIHSVVYGGFSIEALHDRIDMAKSHILITADGGHRRGNNIELKKIADEAMARSPHIDACLVVKNTGDNVKMQTGRDFWYHDMLTLPVASPICETEVMDSEAPLFILFTSGTTGKPKGLVHTHGGYSVYTSTTHKMVFDIKDDDRWWCAADPGWITGHSYIVYSPLINGATIVLYEGALNYPYPDRIWKIIEKYSVSILYTSPTAIRAQMRFGDSWTKRHDLSSLRLLGSVGEPINPEAWNWYHEVIGGGRCPIMDTWWQTETGGFMITPVPTMPLKPGSATKPFFGNEVGVVDENGNATKPNEEGFLVIKNPWPGMARTILNDDERYKKQYWGKYEKQGWYEAGDSAKVDEDGYFWIIGRVDDVIKVSGYRLGTAEVESAIISHQSVAESAVIGLPDDLKGSIIRAYVILKNGVVGSDLLSKEVKAHVRSELGAIAVPESVEFVESLPKTRSGKIMRRVLKAKALGQDVGDISTLED